MSTSCTLLLFASLTLGQAETTLTSHYDHLKILEPLVGTWLRTEVSPTEGETTTRAVHKWILNKNVWLGEIYEEADGKSVLAHRSMTFWDSSKKQIRGVGCDSIGGHFEGIMVPQGNKIVFEGKMCDGEGTTRIVRSVISIADDSNFSFVLTAGDKGEETTVRYKRVKQ